MILEHLVNYLMIAENHCHVSNHERSTPLIIFKKWILFLIVLKSKETSKIA